MEYKIIQSIQIILIILLLMCLILIFVYLFDFDENFNGLNSFDFTIQTPLTNYNKIILKINDFAKWKNKFSSSANPIITSNCNVYSNESDCIGNNCNWFGNVCSSIYSNLY